MNAEKDARQHHRLRLRLPNGAELEAEGSPEFIAEERREFLGRSRAQEGSGSGGKERPVPGATTPGFQVEWGTLTESKGPGALQLRAKLREAGHGAREACLVLLAAAESLLRVQKPTAAQLARWLRASGYPVGRIDRVLQDSVSKGEILASGSRRARRYELSGPGKARAYILAERVQSAITG